MLGTVAAVLSLLQDFVLITLAAERVKRPAWTDGWCKLILFHSVPLFFCLMLDNSLERQHMQVHLMVRYVSFTSH